jgi:hypothetical protein
MRAAILALFLALPAAAQEGAALYERASTTGTVPTTRSVGTGTSTSTGLSGGGDLSADRSLSCVAASSSSAGCLTTGAQTVAGAKTFSSKLASSVASGSTGFSLLQGARLTLNEGTDTAYLSADSSQYMHLVAKSKDFQFDEFGVITANGLSFINSSTSTAIELRGSASTSALAVNVLINTFNTYSNDGSLLLKITNGGGSNQKLGVRHDGSVQFTGVATGSLLTCDAAHKGSLQYDTTANKLKVCTGSTWETITSS